MKKAFRKTDDEITDKNKRPIQVDDICKITFPLNKKIHGKSGTIKEISRANNGVVSIGLKLHKSHKTTFVTPSSLIRTKKAEHTSEYNIHRRNQKHKKSGGSYAYNNDRNEPTDALGNSMANYAVRHAILKAAGKEPS